MTRIIELRLEAHAVIPEIESASLFIMHPTLIMMGTERILVDCGYPYQLDALSAELRAHGCSVEALTKVILTHQDHDHIGAASEIIACNPTCKLYCPRDELAEITGQTPLLRTLEAPKEVSTKAQVLVYEKFMEFLKKIPLPKHTAPLSGGDIVPDTDGNLEVVDTHGHTPGHISLYLKKEQVLIAGDALILVGKQLRISNPKYSFNKEASIEAVRTISELPLKAIYTYHGGQMTDGIEDGLLGILRYYEGVS